MRDRFNKMNIAIKKLSNQVRDGFDVIRKDLADIQLDELMASLQAMNFAYQNMQQVTLQTNVTTQIKNIYTDRYRAACNRPHFTPEDIFRNLYGYACGDNKARRCDVHGVKDGMGSCKYGVKKRQYILGITIETANKRPSSLRSIGEWILQAMLLAQFHFDVCLPADATTCNDPFTDQIRYQTAADQMLAFQEVATNVERESICLQNLTFAEYLKSPDFYTNAVQNDSCFDNECMAKKTKEKLEMEYPDKEWTVIVYSGDIFFRGDSMNVVRKCQPIIYYDVLDPAGYNKTNMNGCIMTGLVPFEGQDGRWFHLMYRSIYSKPKDYRFAQPLIPNITGYGGGPKACDDYVIGSKTYNALPDLLRDQGIRAFNEDTRKSFCWAHPFSPVGYTLPPVREYEQTCHQYLLRASHGFLALKQGPGIRVGFALGNFTEESGTVFKSPNFLEQYGRDDNCGQKQGGVQEKFWMFY
jgi:hypothetical protein